MSENFDSRPEALFAERLAILMDREGVSKYELASRTGISQATIAGYRQGFTSPGADNIRALAKFFNCTSDYLIGLTDDIQLSAKAHRIAVIIDSMKKFEQNWCLMLIEAIQEKMESIRKPKGKALDIDFIESIRNSL